MAKPRLVASQDRLYVRSYAHLWVLPPPLPRRWPVWDVLTFVLVHAKIVAAVVLPELV